MEMRLKRSGSAAFAKGVQNHKYTPINTEKPRAFQRPDGLRRSLIVRPRSGSLVLNVVFLALARFPGFGDAAERIELRSCQRSRLARRQPAQLHRANGDAL